LEIQTPRLKLIALTAEQLRLYLEDPDQLEQTLGFPVARAILTEIVHRAIRIKLSKMAQAPAQDYAWYTYWLVVPTARPYGAGLAGFKGVPDGQGEVELGYGIDPACQGQGYATEAARALIGWAFRSPACSSVIAPNTLRSNVASNRVLEKAGMSVYAETADAISWRISKEDAGRAPCKSI
jgi:ribosomal-protein-alanine N-acetyltransferase